MKTNKISKALLAVFAGSLIMASTVQAQNAVQNNRLTPPPPPPVNGAPAPPPLPPGTMAPPPPQQPLQPVTTYKGTVVKFATNDDYVYDGFYLSGNGDSLLVKFPPHLGTQITGAVKTGATVSVNGVMNVAPMGEKEIRMISIAAGGKTIADTASPAATPPAETYVSGNGKITQLQTNREGVVNGLIVDGKTILRIPPHIANQLSPVAKTNASVAYTGMKKAAKNGEVSTAEYAIVHCKTITINGSQYLVQ